LLPEATPLARSPSSVLLPHPPHRGRPHHCLIRLLKSRSLRSEAVKSGYSTGTKAPVNPPNFPAPLSAVTSPPLSTLPVALSTPSLNLKSNGLFLSSIDFGLSRYPLTASEAVTVLTSPSLAPTLLASIGPHGYEQRAVRVPPAPVGLGRTNNEAAL